jgi:SAM-dependent methyltransferase
MTLRFNHLDRYPKSLPELTEEQKRIREDFYKVWLEALPQRFGLIEQFNHRYPLRTYQPGVKTLDIGAGRGEHAAYEKLDQQEYVGLELRLELADLMKANHPQIRTHVGDIQTKIDFPDGYFDRILTIHVLEHLPDLPRALDEIKRLLSPQGHFTVLMPCDPGLAYNMARNLSARRIFEQRYNQKYDWFVACEHINHWSEILTELHKRFKVSNQIYFPLVVPIPTINLVIGLTLEHL